MKNYVNVNINDIKKMVTESVAILLENRESKNVAFARRFLEQNGYDEAQRAQMINNIRIQLPNSRLQQSKFLLGVTRMYVTTPNLGRKSINDLENTLEIVASPAHVNEYDYNLNGLSLAELVDRFRGEVEAKAKEAQDASNASQRQVNPDYTIVAIDNPDEAAKYGQYTSWCVTHYPNMYNNYTNNGSGRFYFCLKDGFEKERAVRSEGCPLDAYGLSMIAVSITMDGKPNTITCRWNHDNGGNDHVMPVEELEELLGRNFYDTFKPYTKEELRMKGYLSFEEVQDALDNGANPSSLFQRVTPLNEQYSVVLFQRKYNIMTNEGHRITLQEWFDNITPCKQYNTAFFQNGGQFKYMDYDGNLLNEHTFSDISRDAFASPFACPVQIQNGGWGLINYEGKEVSEFKYKSFSDVRKSSGVVFIGIIDDNDVDIFNHQGKLICTDCEECDPAKDNGESNLLIVYKKDRQCFVIDASTGQVVLGPYSRCRFAVNNKFIDGVVDDANGMPMHILVNAANKNVVAENYTRLRYYEDYNCILLYSYADEQQRELRICIISMDGQDIGNGFRYTSVSSFGRCLLFETVDGKYRILFNNGNLTSEFEKIRHNVGIKDGQRYLLDFNNGTETPER